MKSGTTVLYEFINEHESVTPATMKEIHYFTLHQDKGVEWYKQHFPVNNELLVGEASPTYFDIAKDRTIPKNIQKLIPDVKLILIVRDPVDRAISHFSHLCRINKIKELADMDINDFFGRSFSEAFLQTNEIDRLLAQVLSFSNYYQKYLNYISVFEKGQLLVLSNEELLKHPQSVMKRVFSFLGLNPIESSLFEKFKYSTGDKKRAINEKNISRLKEYLYPDYKAFCSATGLTCNVKAPPTPQQDPDVMEGSNGWLFLVGGSNNLLKYYTGQMTLDKSMIQSWHRLLQNRYRKLSERRIDFVHVVVPNKLTLYPEFTTIDLPCFSGHPMKAFMSGIEDFDGTQYLSNVIDPISFLKKQKEHYQLFYKTDSHWTALGCFCVYQLICAKLDAKQNQSLLSRDYSEGNCTFDLGGKLAPQRKEKARFYNFIKDAVRVYENEIVAYKEKNNLENDGGLHVGSNVIYTNSKAENQKVVVLFGDSFSEYRPHLLTGMLAETFSEVHFVWSSSIDYKYVDTVNPDIVITQTVERFMPSVPSDNFSLEKYVKRKLANVVHS